MSYNMNDFQANMASLNPLVRGKALDLINENPDDTRDKDTLFADSKLEAEKWFEEASEEEKEDIRRRYPDDMDIKD